MFFKKAFLLLTGISCCMASIAFDTSWKSPLAEKEKILEANIVERHSILGLYPSQVQVPLDGSPVDNTTSGISNIAHSVCWTANYLAGASYRYAFLKKSGAPEEEVTNAKLRADELFEAVYRCQLVTGVRGLQSRGYAIGHGESYEEREDADTRNDWHQGEGEYSNLRWRGDPSHHNYSDAIHGLCQYYDLAAEGPQKERAREAIDALASRWVDNDFMIQKLDPNRMPTPILGLTDGKTLNTRIMMAIAGAKYAHHATGKEKFLKTYQQLIQQYGVRGLKTFRAGKDFDDAEHVFCHLENLFRIEKDPELLAAYRVVLDELWKIHKDDGQSLFTYIYMSLTPDAPGREKALQEALFTLQTWPTDMTIKPVMSSLNPDLHPPYPVYAASWDNEYMWKGSLLNPNGWLSRTVMDVAVSAEDPMVIYAIDTSGDVYQSRDGAQTAAGWRVIDRHLPSKAVAIEAGHKVRFVFAACRDGFYGSSTGGAEWERLPIPDDGGEAIDIEIDPENPFVLYATTSKGIYRSADFGEEFIGKKWESLTSELPQADKSYFKIASAKPGRIYAILDGVGFTRRLDESDWTRTETVAQPYGEVYPWLIADPSNPDRAFGAIKAPEMVGAGDLTNLRETQDGGVSWNNDLKDQYERFRQGGFQAIAAQLVPFALTKPVISEENPQVIYSGNKVGILKSTDGGKTWKVFKQGLDIPWVKEVFVPRNTNWIFAGTPAGLYISKDNGENWESGNLVLQFEKNTRREIGGAAYIDAYWRARYYGLIDEETASAPYRD